MPYTPQLEAQQDLGPLPHRDVGRHTHHNLRLTRIWAHSPQELLGATHTRGELSSKPVKKPGRAMAASKHVVPAGASKHVVPSGASKHVVPAGASKHVVPAGASKHVVPTGASKHARTWWWQTHTQACRGGRQACKHVWAARKHASTRWWQALTYVISKHASTHACTQEGTRGNKQAHKHASTRWRKGCPQAHRAMHAFKIGGHAPLAWWLCMRVSVRVCVHVCMRAGMRHVVQCTPNARKAAVLCGYIPHPFAGYPASFCW